MDPSDLFWYGRGGLHNKMVLFNMLEQTILEFGVRSAGEATLNDKFARLSNPKS